MSNIEPSSAIQNCSRQHCFFFFFFFLEKKRGLLFQYFMLIVCLDDLYEIEMLSLIYYKNMEIKIPSVVCCCFDLHFKA